MVETTPPHSSASDSTETAEEYNERGLFHYRGWEMDEAIAAFEEAATADPANPDYHLNLARAHARNGDFGEALRCVGDYLSTETDETVSERYERLFSSALDNVEEQLIDTMRAMDLQLPVVGKAIQMWLEYRISAGRRPLPIPEPNAWAAALTYAVCRINFREVTRADVVAAYDTSDEAVREKYDELVATLDLMPADFRYFAGEENPLDKLVEAAHLLEEIYGRFYED
ncbi:MAG: tetratricopeptide repeat protein [Candidatus Promineifilaceae bacterium]|nr:tetratricopeptide repeat protein [Candidatus Promineifilaceae bacterium]